MTLFTITCFIEPKVPIFDVLKVNKGALESESVSDAVNITWFVISVAPVVS